MVTFLVIAFTLCVAALAVWGIIVLPRHEEAAKKKPTTLARPAKGGRGSKCPHTRYTKVDVNGIVVGHLCLDCDEQLGPVVTRDPDGYVYFAEYD